ncbi:MAG: hypothetical protein ACE5GY_05215 [Thermodesulfobacteriota bacterium]
MFSIAMIPVAAAVVIAAGILCYFFPSEARRLLRLATPGRAKVQEKQAPEERDMAGDELRAEVRKVRQLAAELNKGRLDLEWSERRLEDKSRRLDSLIEKAEDTLRKAASTGSQTRSGKYAKAGLLLEMGIPSARVKQRLGLLSGEVELIETLYGHRPGPGSAPKRKKTPHPEYSARRGPAEGLHDAGHVA